MKETLPVLTMFGLGVTLGAGGFIPQWLLPKGITMTILCILVFQVGLSIGSNDKFSALHDSRHAVVLSARQPVHFWPQHSRLPGRRQRICLLFVIFSTHNRTKKRLSRSADCHRTWHACAARKHRKRSGLAARSPLILEVFRQICPYISRRYQLDGRTPAIYKPLFGQRNDTCRHHARHSPRAVSTPVGVLVLRNRMRKGEKVRG